MTEQMKKTEKSTEGLIPLNRDQVQSNLDDIILSNTPLYRMKKDGTRVIVPVEKLDQFMGEHGADMTFYLETDWRKHLPERGDSRVPPAERMGKERRGEVRRRPPAGLKTRYLPGGLRIFGP